MFSILNKSIKGQATYVACFVVCALMSFDAMAQSDLYNRLTRAERDIETLSRALYKGDKLPDSMASSIQDDQKHRAQVGVRMSDLETQIRELRGSIEQLQYSIDSLSTKIEDVEKKSIEQQTITTSSSNSVLPSDNSIVYTNETTVDTTKNLSGEATPSKIYDDAFSLLKRGDNASAQKAFESFIAAYPSDSLTPNARYWLGESHYVQNQYAKSARIFAEAYQKDPKGSKAPDNLLKLGLSLSGLDRKEDACVSLSQLSKEFGNTSSAIIRRAEQESEKLGC